MFFQLRHVAANRAPARDLAQIILAASPAIISAIPLEPAARVFEVNPTFASPLGQGLRRVDAKIIQRRSRLIRRKLRAFEPAFRKFLLAIGHVFSAEHAKLEHLFRRQLGRESGAECAPHRFCVDINIALLHFVVHLHPDRFHVCPCRAFARPILLFHSGI